jgi:hypothetical protein
MNKKKIEELRENQYKQRIRFASYEPVNIIGEFLQEAVIGLNGRIVLLQSEHSGRAYFRGELSYDATDPEVLRLKSSLDNKIITRTIHLHDITGLMREITSP